MALAHHCVVRVRTVVRVVVGIVRIVLRQRASRGCSIWSVRIGVGVIFLASVFCVLIDWLFPAAQHPTTECNSANNVLAACRCRLVSMSLAGSEINVRGRSITARRRLREAGHLLLHPCGI